MFVRSAFRTAQPLKQQFRRYAIVNPPPNNQAVYIYAGGALVAGGAYYLYNRNSTLHADAPPSNQEQQNVPATNQAFTGGEQGFISLRLDSVDLINHNTKKFRFALPNVDDISGLPITSALITKYKGPEDAKPTIRPYTPVSAETEKGYVDFVVKKYPGGPMSTHLHDMEPGQRLDFKGPIPKYPWEANKHPNIALIAGGTGITPMYQLTRAIFSNPSDKTSVTLVFGNLTEEDILLKREFEELENTYPNRFRAFYLLDKPPRGWQQGSGHITKELLKTVLPFEPKDGTTGSGGKIFVCGPPGLYKAVSGAKKSPQEQGELTGMLKELGYGEEQVYKF